MQLGDAVDRTSGQHIIDALTSLEVDASVVGRKMRTRFAAYFSILKAYTIEALIMHELVLRIFVRVWLYLSY